MIGTRFQNGSLKLVKNKRADDSWFFRYYEDVDGKRVHRNVRIGSVREFPRRRDAEKAVLAFRSTINSGVRAPQTVSELIAHYKKYELTLARKAFATVDVHESFLALYIEPKWGTSRLTDVRTVAVERWLDALPYAPATRTKIRNLLSALYSHAIRHEWTTFNPISKVRTSAKRLREPDVLTPAEFQALFALLPLRERAAVMLAGSTGLRRSELFALRWSDINFITKEVAVTRSCVRNHIGETKTAASRKPVALEPFVGALLTEWRGESLYKLHDDFLFPSIRRNGKQPLAPDTVLKKIIRPALVRAGVEGKVIGWHSFRHLLATYLRSLGEDVKVAQELLRHANSRTTLDIYTQAISARKHEAVGRVVDLLLSPTSNSQELSDRCVPSESQAAVA